MELFYTPIDDPALIILTVVFAVTASITTFDKRLLQARKSGVITMHQPILPNWVGVIGWIHWIIGLSILLLNWKYALLVFILKFLLSVLPVLETIGYILMKPFYSDK